MNNLIKLVDESLEKFLPVEYPEDLFKSMRYTVLLEGKRLRPVLCLEICRALGGKLEDALPTACAIEMLHAQTLIHDDLPCMDNDDFRRGKPSNHKVFGEATAVLAGDALISFAPQVILRNSKNLPSDVLLQVLDDFFTAAGARGVIAGQVVDIESEGHPETHSAEKLEFIHDHKTGDLFRLAIVSGARIAGATCEQIAEVRDFAKNFGLAFQIADDILDVISDFETMGKTLGKDANSGKLTYVSMYGLDNAKCKLTCLLDECNVIIDKYNSEILREIVKGIRKRTGV
ncbi:MAG: polyprenyl synthetase family protein [Fusobacterium sp.]|nr:polyprenyl synthetase family protein [Fusobacterium sp.]